MTPQQKAEKTRARNKAEHDLYVNTIKPARAKVEKVMAMLLPRHDIRLRYVGPRRLKGGATGGRLMGTAFGGLQFTVHIGGYKTPQTYASSFWELEAHNVQ